MNFVIKSVLKKIFTQYLYIEDEGLDLTSGVIKLPQGNINQTRINAKLEPLNIRITSSSYKNLIIHLPLVQFLSKPIRISIQVLDLMVQRVYKAEQSNRKQSQSSIQSNIQAKQQAKIELVEQEKDGYFRNIINRVLYNMQVCMDKINIRLIDNRQEQEFRQAYFTLHSFRLKNSLVILQSNIVKKTLNLDKLHLKHTIGELIINDLNLCLDFSNKKLQIITVGTSIKLNIFKIPFKLILKNISKKKSYKSKKPKQKLDLQQMSIFLKLSIIQINLGLVKIQLNSLQMKNKKSNQYNDFGIKFGQIKCSNIEDKRQQSYLMKIGYLPFKKLVKINSEFQDSAIKQTFVNLKQQFHTNSQLSLINCKIYHLLVNININQCKNLIDRLIKKQKEIQKCKSIINKLKQQQSKEQDKIEDSQYSFSLLVYRVQIAIQYGLLNLQLFGSFFFQVTDHSFMEGRLPLKKIGSNELKQKFHQLDAQKRIILVKIYQLGLRLIGCNMIEITDLHAKYSKKQIVINANTIISQLSLSCFDKMKNQFNIIQRDIAYYQQKFKKIIPLKEPKNQSQIQQHSNKEKILPVLPKIFIKADQIIINIGELIKAEDQQKKSEKQIKNLQKQILLQNKFISILDLQLSKTLLSLINSKIKLNSEIIAFISSPYTLQRTPLTNELQLEVSLGLKNHELNLSLKNKLILLLHDQYINIIYKMLDKEDVWCFITNLTYQKITFLQQTTQIMTLFQEHNQSKPSGLNEQQIHSYETVVQPLSKKHFFWLKDGKFRIIFKNGVSKIFQSKLNSQVGCKLQNSCYLVTKQIILEQDKDYNYIIKLMYNKLGNLCQITINYKILITSHSKNYLFRIGNSSFKLQKSQRQKWEWFLQLQDFIDEFDHYQVISSDLKKLKIEQLMAHQQFSILGIYEEILTEQSQNIRKLYDSYIYQCRAENHIKYIIMPMLIVANSSIQDLQFQIIDKKSQEKQIIQLKSNQKIQLNHNNKFDYYLKQFTIKISIINKEKITFQSQSLYFNTFFMIDHKSQTNIQLRSTQKNDYTKRSLIFQQSLLLKTKVISFKSSIRINNLTDFNFTIAAKQSQTQKIDVDAHSLTQWTYRFKQNSNILFFINRQVESKVQIRYGDIKDIKLLSFNFCKINDRFFNVFIRIQRRNSEGIESIIMDHFIQLINLCNHISTIKIQHLMDLQHGVRNSLPLNSTSLNKYNNKLIDISDITKIYAQIFLTAKITDIPLNLMFQNESIRFQEFIKQSTQQLSIKKDKFIITLLKDMNNNKITFYLTDRLFNPKSHYTIFNNQTSSYFLLTDDFQYAPHFSHQSSNCSTVPEKVFISSQSFNCLANRQNYDLLLCDQLQTHLGKIDKKMLQKQRIKLQQYNFDSITLFDCVYQENMNVRKQLITKQIEIRIRMYGKMQLSFSLQALTLRLLEAGKFDCLIQDISIKNQESKDHLLRIPEETYLLVQGKSLRNNYFFLVKNLFVKCKNIIVNIKRQMPYSLIELITNLTEKIGLNLDHQQQLSDPRKFRQNVKKLNGQTKLRNYIKEQLLLIRNLYIHQIHLSLTIELENLSFSNVIILPFYEVLQKFQRFKHFTDNLSNFYLTTLLAKFPKLSFLMSNFKSPLNTLRLFFNFRQALKKKIQNQPVINFGHHQFSNNPFHFSVQRWNIVNNSKRNHQPEQNIQQIISYLFQGKKCLILTNKKVHWLDDDWRSLGLRQLQKLKIYKNRGSSQLILKFKGFELCIIEQHKKCMKMVNHIERLIL